MMTKKVSRLLAIAFVSCFLSNAWAIGPCEQIVQACQQAGFAKKEYKEGKGIARDCINPIMQNKPAPGMALPSIAQNQQVIAACRTKRPNFGSGKVGM